MLTSLVYAVITKMFPSQQAEVSQLLEKECGYNLPLVEQSESGLERIRLAVLKISNGDIDILLSAIRIAQEDWRDTLMGAGFGYQLSAHGTWAKDYLQPSSST